MEWLAALWAWIASPGWSGWATIAGVLTGAGTIVLAVAAILQGRATKSQVELGNRQANIAEEQLRLAQDAADAAEVSARSAAQVQLEAIRARADQGAPEVVAYFNDPFPPVYVSEGPRHGVKPRKQYSEYASQTVDLEHHKNEFTMPSEEGALILVSGTGTLANEGSVAAKVRLPHRAWFSDWEQEYEAFVQGPWRSGVEEAVLKPGASASFTWFDVVPFGAFVKGSERPGVPVPGDSVWLWTVVFDRREVGVIDTTLAQIPLTIARRVPGSNERWKFASDESLKVYVHPTRRNYRAEGAATEDVSLMHAHYGLASGGLAKLDG